MIYVIIQFACILFLVITTDFATLPPFSWLLVVIALVIAILALVAMKLPNLNALPKLKDNHQLVTSGIYQYVRHPMYCSVLLFCLGLVAASWALIPLLVFAILLIDLTLKANLEEQYLLERFSEYENYQKKTGKFIPFF